MAKQNLAFLYGRVAKAPVVSKNQETGEYNYGMVYIDTVRGKRSVGDDLKYVKHDRPLIMSREKEILDSLINWKENDIVFIKGVVSSKRIPKFSYCPDCKDDNGQAVRNESYGNLIFITPIFVEKVASSEDEATAKECVLSHQEISNQIYIYGTLLRDPKLFTTAKNKKITQYPIAINRKFTIRTDDPSIKTDWPVVKSYGEQAIQDKIYLESGADVIVDGFLQARSLTRKATCSCCGKEYQWKDHAMEIVPYTVEYVSGHKSKEQVEAEYQNTVETIMQSLFNEGRSDELEEGIKSDECQ